MPSRKEGFCFSQEHVTHHESSERGAVGSGALLALAIAGNSARESWLQEDEDGAARNILSPGGVGVFFCPDVCKQPNQATDYKEKFEPLIKKGATLGLSHGFLLGESSRERTRSRPLRCL